MAPRAGAGSEPVVLVILADLFVKQATAPGNYRASELLSLRPWDWDLENSGVATDDILGARGRCLRWFPKASFLSDAEPTALT